MLRYVQKNHVCKNEENYILTYMYTQKYFKRKDDQYFVALYRCYSCTLYWQQEKKEMQKDAYNLSPNFKIQHDFSLEGKRNPLALPPLPTHHTHTHTHTHTQEGTSFEFKALREILEQLAWNSEELGFYTGRLRSKLCCTGAGNLRSHWTSDSPFPKFPRGWVWGPGERKAVKVTSKCSLLVPMFTSKRCRESKG